MSDLKPMTSAQAEAEAHERNARRCRRWWYRLFVGRAMAEFRASWYEQKARELRNRREPPQGGAE